MIKRLCAGSVVLVAAAGVTLLASPAQADVRNGNWSGNRASSQSGNNFSRIGAFNRAGGGSTNVNNLNGFTATSSHGSVTIVYIFK
ncbi:hypothetical protein [Nonomuraea longicatena]|uniref:Secreted protein n=1 Tax=Nonomuraea longicatena TaxID=83682 RepID=A0ABP4B8A3_9ACTN